MRVFTITREFTGAGGGVIAPIGHGARKSDLDVLSGVELTPELRKHDSPLTDVTVIDKADGGIILDVAEAEDDNPKYALVHYALPGGTGKRSDIRPSRMKGKGYVRHLAKNKLHHGWSVQDGASVQGLSLIQYSDGEAGLKIHRVGGGFGPKDVLFTVDAEGHTEVEYEENNPEIEPEEEEPQGDRIYG